MAVAVLPLMLTGATTLGVTRIPPPAMLNEVVVLAAPVFTHAPPAGWSKRRVLTTRLAAVLVRPVPCTSMLALFATVIE